MEQMHTREEKMEAFGRLLDVMDRLRVECPWDRKQTNESLRPNTIEETYELCDALIRNDQQEICKELGDFLFAVINAARLYKLNPDNALEMTNQKFTRRFNYIEQHSIRAGKPLTEMTLEEMDQLWNEAKEQERQTIKD